MDAFVRDAVASTSNDWARNQDEHDDTDRGLPILSCQDSIPRGSEAPRAWGKPSKTVQDKVAKPKGRTLKRGNRPLERQNMAHSRSAGTQKEAGPTKHRNHHVKPDPARKRATVSHFLEGGRTRKKNTYTN